MFDKINYYFYYFDNVKNPQINSVLKDCFYLIDLIDFSDNDYVNVSDNECYNKSKYISIRLGKHKN